MDVIQAAQRLLEGSELRRCRTSETIADNHRASLGQFFTPSSIAQFIASLPLLTPPPRKLRVLDPGAGTGALTAALVARLAVELPGIEIAVTAFELDDALRPELERTLQECQELAALSGSHLTARVITGDFLDWAANEVGTLPFAGEPERFDLAVMNPPYRKVNTFGTERRALERINVEVTNLYVAFLAMSAELLVDGGQLAAITPRSFANGPYFRSFRRYFFERMRFTQIHLYESRSKAFARDAVLQENVIFCARRETSDPIRDQVVTISTSEGPADPHVIRSAPHSEIVRPDDPDAFVHITTDEADVTISHVMEHLPTRLPQLGIQVSTGRVVDFRAREHLRDDLESDSVPLIYPAHLRDGAVTWPGTSRRKPAAIACRAETDALLLPSETFVLVKRFTSKEERRRVVAVVFDRGSVPTDRVAFENHLNVFHVRGRGLEDAVAQGLAAWLNSTAIDRFLRIFSGHTQVNATDLRRLPYPSISELRSIGATVGGSHLEQDRLDALVSQYVKELPSFAA